MSLPTSNNHISTNGPQFEFKAGSFTLPLLRLLDTNMDALAEQLTNKINEAEGFFHNAPIVIDLKEIDNKDIEFAILSSIIRNRGMVPVGVRGGNEQQHADAEAVGLAVLADSRPQRVGVANKPTTAEQSKSEKQEKPENSDQSEKPETPSLPTPSPIQISDNNSTTLITKHIRSGQRVYAQGGDLIVLGQVSSGAEVMADGNIHVYAALRGRALAGLNGNQNVRIFCQDLRAELISVAGHYRVSENIDARLQGHPIQVYLEDRILRIESL